MLHRALLLPDPPSGGGPDVAFPAVTADNERARLRRRSRQRRMAPQVAGLRRQVDARHDRSLRQPLPRGAFPPDWPEPSRTPAADLFAIFFGTFALYHGQTQLALGYNRAVVELCCYLIARSGQRIPRDELLDLLWPDGDPTLAVHRLHVTVSSLRHILDVDPGGGGVVRLDGECYSIPAQAVVADCQLFEREYERGKLQMAQGDLAGAAASLRAALGFCRGEFLQDHRYAEWTQQPRTHFAERRLLALTLVCEHAALEHEHLTVLEYAQQILELDSLRERAHRHLMRAHCHLGQRGCALRQYETCARVLQEELGIPPSEQTQRLLQAIRDDAPLPVEPPIRL